jgi:hypothetical protein
MLNRVGQSRRLRGDSPSRQVYAVARSTRPSHPMIDVLVQALRSSAGSYLKEAA